MEKKIYMSSMACSKLKYYLYEHDFNITFLDGNGSPVYDEVSTHADIHMCQLGLWENAFIFPGNISKLQRHYPGNIIYNAVCTGKYFIHNMKYTDEDLLHCVRNWHDKNFTDSEHIFISVPQGYTRCCCLPVDDTSFITSDEGIFKILKSHDTDVLLINKGYVMLPGFDYGFIGGCAGHIIADGRRAIVFNGSLESHPDHEKITAFIKDRDIDIVSFKNEPLSDIGSILAC